MNENLFTKSVQDFLTPQMLKISFAPFVVTLILFYLLFFFVTNMGLESLHNSTMHIESTQTTMQNGIPHTKTTTTDLEDTSILQYIMSHTITSWLLSFFIYTIGGFFTLLISIVIAIVVIGFLTPTIVKVIHQRYYSDIDLQGFGGIFDISWYMMKTIFIMIMLLFLLIPLYFIPVVGIFILNLPFYYLFHKSLTYDVGSTILTKEQYAQIHFKNKGTLRLKTLLLFSISLIPFAILFTSAFFVIYLAHNYFFYLKQLPTTVIEST
jgi:hypothetical protein